MEMQYTNTGSSTYIIANPVWYYICFFQTSLSLNENDFFSEGEWIPECQIFYRGFGKICSN